MAVSINSELARFAQMEYLNSMSASELAYWLINAFTPTRYRDKNDVIEFACRKLYHRSTNLELIVELLDKLWAMHGETPDHMPFIHNAKVIAFRKVN